MVNTWKNKRVLVTGANGFIGQWLCKALANSGAEVTGIVRSEDKAIKECAKTVAADVTDGKALSKIFQAEKPEICFHLAAKSSTKEAAKNLRSTVETNIMGTLNVLEAAKETGTGIVFTSSVKVYGGKTEKGFSEEDALNGSTPYAASKVAGEALCRMFAKSFGLSVGIARPGNVFGGFDPNNSRLVPNVVVSALEGKAPKLSGKGESKFDFVYVEDVAEGMIRLGEKVLQKTVEAEAFNLGSGKSNSVKELAKKAMQIIGKEIEPEYSGEEIYAQEHLRIEKAKKELGWAPSNTFEQGLEKTIECFKKSIN